MKKDSGLIKGFVEDYLHKSPYVEYKRESNIYARFLGLDPNTAVNGEWDEFRHAYSSARMTQNDSVSEAHLYGELNEIRGDFFDEQPAEQKTMDRWNNAVGRDIGEKAKAEGLTHGQIAERVLAALRRGELITDPDNDFRIYDPLNLPTENEWNKPNGLGLGGADAGKAGAIAPIRRDPLALDLDGDGIEIISLNEQIVLFDHDGDGLKTGSSWLDSDDGWVVLDRNNNGVIDSGQELFGVDTRKSNGQFATDGFDALKDFDAHFDGINLSNQPKTLILQNHVLVN